MFFILYFLRRLEGEWVAVQEVFYALTHTIATPRDLQQFAIVLSPLPKLLFADKSNKISPKGGFLNLVLFW